MKHSDLRFSIGVLMLASTAITFIDAQQPIVKPIVTLSKAQRIILKEEDAKLDAFLKTFVLTAHVHTSKDPIIETYQQSSISYMTQTYYDIKNRTVTLDIQFKDGTIHTINKPVLLFDYRLLSPAFIHTLREGMAKFIKQNKLHDGRSVYFLTSPMHETFKLTVVYPWHNKEVTQEAQIARSQRDWKEYQAILLENQPVVYFTGTHPITPIYRISNLVPLIKKIVAELKKGKIKKARK